MPKLAISGIVLLILGSLCFLVPPLTHSGIGSCGPYGPTGFLTIFGIILLPAGIVISFLQPALYLLRRRHNLTSLLSILTIDSCPPSTTSSSSAPAPPASPAP